MAATAGVLNEGRAVSQAEGDVMISDPENDGTCLGAITRVVEAMVTARDPQLVELAARYPTTTALIAWIQSLPQRDDLGKRGDGPTVDECVPHQRLRIPADDPNCVERAALYLAVAELIDPGPIRRLRTEDTPVGLHTFVVEDDEPVSLDPRVTRNALRGAITASNAAKSAGEGARTTIAIPMGTAIDWIAELAEEHAAHTEPGMADRARVAMHAAMQGATLPGAAIREVALTLALAEREARAFGPAGIEIVQRATETLIARTSANATSAVRNLSLRVGGYTIRPDWDRIARIGRAAGRVGERAGWLALRSYLGTLGVHPVMLGEIERELSRQELTLGPLATEPDAPPNSIGAAAAALAGG